ncbi:MAG: GGDEF domain-containing protein [Pseudomonadota bacterium]
MLIGVGIVAIIAALKIASLSLETAVIAGFALFVCATSIVLARSALPVQVAATFLIVAWLVALLVVAHLRGGLGAPLMIAVPTVPVIAAVVISRRAAWLVCSAILIGLGVLWSLQFGGQSIFNVAPLNAQYDFMRAFWVAVSALMATKLATYMTMRSERLATQLEDLASTDALTGVRNRRAISAILETEVARTRRRQEPLAILLLDVDHFKALNDSQGHLAGDAALRRIADAIQPLLRTGGDALGRWGGEEFLVVLPNTEPEEAVNVAERIRRCVMALEIPRHVDVNDVLTVTIGAAGEMQPTSSTALLKAADEALYLGKNGGRNRIEVLERAPPITR